MSLLDPRDSLGTGFEALLSRRENQGTTEDCGVQVHGPCRVAARRAASPNRDGEGDTPGGTWGTAQGLDHTWPPPRWVSRPGDDVCPIPRPGEAFRCFTCEQPTAIPLCKNITRCKPEATACMTTLVLMEAGESGPQQAQGPQWSPSPRRPSGLGVGPRGGAPPRPASVVPHEGGIGPGAPGSHLRAGTGARTASRPSHQFGGCRVKGVEVGAAGEGTGPWRSRR